MSRVCCNVYVYSSSKSIFLQHMAEKSEADAAVEKLHGQLVDGCRITVDVCIQDIPRNHALYMTANVYHV